MHVPVYVCTSVHVYVMCVCMCMCKYVYVCVLFEDSFFLTLRNSKDSYFSQSLCVGGKEAPWVSAGRPGHVHARGCER